RIAIALGAVVVENIDELPVRDINSTGRPREVRPLHAATVLESVAPQTRSRANARIVHAKLTELIEIWRADIGLGNSHGGFHRGDRRPIVKPVQRAADSRRPRDARGGRGPAAAAAHKAHPRSRCVAAAGAGDGDANNALCRDRTDCRRRGRARYAAARDNYGGSRQESTAL